MIISQSPALAVQRSQRSFRWCLVTLRSCGVGTRPEVDRDPKTRLRNAIAPACCPSVPIKALVVLLNVPRAAVTESPTQLAVVDQRGCGRDAPPKWNLPATTRLQQVGARSGGWKLFTSHFLTDVKPPLSMQYQWADSKLLLDSCIGRGGSASKIDDASVQFHFCARHFVPMVPPAVISIHMRTLSVDGRKKRKGNVYLRTTPTENSGPKVKFRLLRSLVKLLTFQNFKPKRVNKSEMLQNFSQTHGTIFHSSACISSSEGFFKNRSAHFCGKSPSSGACPSQIAILLSLGLKFLMKWKPTYIYSDLNFSDSQQVFANLFSWRKLEGSLIISWKFQGRTPQEIWITVIFPTRSRLVSYDVLHHSRHSRMGASWPWCVFPDIENQPFYYKPYK